MKRWMGLVLLGGCALSAVAGCSNDTETAATGATSGQSSSSGAGGASSSSGGTTTSTGANSGGGGAGSGGSSTGGSSSGGDVTMGLVAYYPFDGNADDASGNNHHGNVVGATFGADVGGTAMSALSVSTATDFVDVGDIAAFDFGSGSLSLTYWFKTASAKAYLGVLANGCGAWAGGYCTGLNWDTGRILFGVGNAIGLAGSANVVGLNTSATFNDDAWHHVAAVLDKPANRAMIYVDGQKETLVKFDNFGVTGGTLVAGDTELDITGVDYVATPSELTTRIGNTHYGQNFEGTVDEVRVYDRALTTAEVTTLFTGGN